MAIDIIIFAAVAIYLLFRLRGELGKHGEEDKRTEYGWVEKAKKAAADVIDVVDIKADRQPKVASPVQVGLNKIKARDASFSAKGFVDGAQVAFEEIITAFSRNDKKALRPLLEEPVYQAFAKVIEAREAKGEFVETTLIALEQSDIVAADLNNDVASVSIKFASEQVNITRDRDGNIVDGSPNDVHKMRERWTFERDVNSKDPNWLLAEIKRDVGSDEDKKSDK